MTFQTQYSYFKYQIILFELFNVPTNFQGYINKILALSSQTIAKILQICQSKEIPILLWWNIILCLYNILIRYLPRG